MAEKVEIVESNAEYETFAAGVTDSAVGATGKKADFLSHILIVPATTSPGAVSIKDGSGSAIVLFAGGATSVATLHPFHVMLRIKSRAGAWKVSAGANVSVLAAGNFT